jgi:hypothetical protein
MKRARITEARIGVNRQWNMESGLGVLQSSALGLCFISVRLPHLAYSQFTHPSLGMCTLVVQLQQYARYRCTEIIVPVRDDLA